MAEKCILDPERDCLGLIKAKEVEHDLEKLEKRNSDTHERLFGRVENLEKAEVRWDERFNQTLNTLDSITENLKAIVGRLEAIEHKPAKRWESVTSQIVTLVVAALVGFILAKLGLK